MGVLLLRAPPQAGGMHGLHTLFPMGLSDRGGMTFGHPSASWAVAGDISDLGFAGHPHSTSTKSPDHPQGISPPLPRHRGDGQGCFTCCAFSLGTREQVGTLRLKLPLPFPLCDDAPVCVGGGLHLALPQVHLHTPPHQTLWAQGSLHGLCHHSLCRWSVGTCSRRPLARKM